MVFVGGSVIKPPRDNNRKWAAVGAGVTSLLFFLTLRKINALKGMERDEE